MKTQKLKLWLVVGVVFAVLISQSNLPLDLQLLMSLLEGVVIGRAVVGCVEAGELRDFLIRRIALTTVFVVVWGVASFFVLKVKTYLVLDIVTFGAAVGVTAGIIKVSERNPRFR